MIYANMVCAGNTYYLSNSTGGDNTNSGLNPDCNGSVICENGPFETLNYALKKLVPGDVLEIRDGVYHEITINFGQVMSGNSESTKITVKNYPNESPIIRSTSSLQTRGMQWWVFDGLTFDDTPYFRLGNHDDDIPNTGPDSKCTAITRNVTFRNSNFLNSSNDAIRIECAVDVVIENCIFDNLRSRIMGKDAFGIVQEHYADGLDIRKNKFSDIGGDGIHLLSGGEQYSSNIRINENEFFINRPYVYRDENGETQVGEEEKFGNVGENGVDIKVGPGPITVTGNRFHGFRPTTRDNMGASLQDASGDNGTALIVHLEGNNVLIENNYFYDNVMHVVVGVGSVGVDYDSRSTIIRGNIFSEAYVVTNPIPLQEATGVHVELVSDVEIYNNTFATGGKALTTAGVRNGLFKNNLLINGSINVFSDGERGDNVWTSSNNAFWPGLTVPVEFSNPLLPNYTHNGAAINATNWSPLYDSIVINNGASNSRVKDYYGNPIIDQPDIGAVEFYDLDDDLFSAENDCNDNDPSIYLGAAEIPYDGIDQDCNGSDLTDVDTDGFDSEVVGGPDCNDNAASIYPGADEISYDGIDQDCNGSDLTDVDTDGFDSAVVGGPDCDDDDVSIYPGADDLYNDGIISDCNNAEDPNITIYKAVYSSKKNIVEIEAVTSGGKNDQLTVDGINMGWSKAHRGRWMFESYYPVNPGSVIVRGLKGYIILSL